MRQSLQEVLRDCISAFEHFPRLVGFVTVRQWTAGNESHWLFLFSGGLLTFLFRLVLILNLITNYLKKGRPFQPPQIEPPAVYAGDCAMLP